MSFTGTGVDVLQLLYHQHNSYTVELGRTHQFLSKLYKKLAKVERVLAEKQERELSRSEKKKWQYMRTLSKRATANLESQQASLHDALRQCNELIASYEQSAYSSAVSTPWTQVPPSPYLFTPYSPIAYTPWTASPPGPMIGRPSETTPQYWDLSMLQERRQSSKDNSSADSGYYEPLIPGVETNEESFDPDHVYAHELMSPTVHNPLAKPFAMAPKNINSSTDESDEVPALRAPPATLDAQRSTCQHKRCYSVDAIQLDQSPPDTSGPKRGASVGPATDRQKQMDERLDVESTAAEALPTGP